MEFDHFDYYSPMELFRITLAAFIPLHLGDLPYPPPPSSLLSSQSILFLRFSSYISSRNSPTPLHITSPSSPSFPCTHRRLALCLVALAVGINSKWYLLGRRKQGAYPWDESRCSTFLLTQVSVYLSKAYTPNRLSSLPLYL